ncbi:MAG TPA: hypothetical protein VFM53_08065 [Anaeromyxobacteraceae bacterium]|nr:hypothetical protein [Anaeromyxobacteraceae bacterium]
MRRLRILAEARERGEAFLRLDPERLRFQLGTSHADVRVPVALADDAAALVLGATAQLGLLLSTQHGKFLPPDVLDRLYLREDYASLPRVADLLGPSTGGPDLRGAAHLALASHPGLTGGLVTAWMGPGGRGRSLTALWIGVLRHAAAEAEGTRGPEETPLLVALALTAAMQSAAAGLREVLPGPPHDRWLRGAALTALWVSARTAVARFARDVGKREDDPLVLRLDAVVSPGALAGGRAGVMTGGSTVYGVDLSAGVPNAEELAQRLAGGGDPDVVVGELAEALAGDEEAGRRAEAAVAVQRFRDLLAGGGLVAEESGQAGATADLRAILAAPGALAQALPDDAMRRELASRLQAVQARLPAGPVGDRLEEAQRALRAWKPREPAAAMGLRREEAREAYALAAAGLLADLALERMLSPARRSIVPPAAAGSLDAEWEAGRLYRVSARPGPILAEAAERPIAHLFADVKDFTRRTSLLGPASMAEFLRREFYLPILAAAKAGFTGMEHLADRGGVSVNNLLGDAISLSGDIEALVALAAEIRRLLSAYERRLEKEVSSEAVRGRVSSLEGRYQAEIARSVAARDEARTAAERAAPGSPERAEALRRMALHAAAATRLAGDRDRDVARTRGEGLEAGVFVSFGPAPLVVAIDDEAFGRNRVAIAEKINESARGTARATPARARADHLLAAARAESGNPELRHAWSVFIGHPLSLPIPPDAAAEVLRAARAGDMTGAMRAVAKPVRRALEAAARADDEGTGDVYNAGAALSEEALAAWLEAVGGKRVVRRVELDPADVPAELSRRFWFGPGGESLVVTFHTDGRPAEMFRHVGRAWFKGLGEVPVWEIAADVGGPAELFQALRARWLDGQGP